MLFTEHSLIASLQGIGITEPGDLFIQLNKAYREPTRFYHTHEHINACLRELQDIPSLLDARREEIEVALWFHDAVYDSHRHDNEEQSAAWARRFLEFHSIEPHVIDRVEALIMITKTHCDPRTDDEAIMIDIDLSILGQTEEVFLTYDEAIRKEYAWVPEDEYRAGRKRVLEGFLNRAAERSIFQTRLFREQYESQAKRNLQQAIDRL